MQFDWSEPFALLAQKPWGHAANVQLPAGPPRWLGSERFASEREALRHSLERWHQPPAAPPVEAQQDRQESPATPSIRAKVKELAGLQSGVHTSTGAQAAAHTLLEEQRDLSKDVRGQEVLQAVAAAISVACRGLPSEEELTATQRVLLAKLMLIRLRARQTKSPGCEQPGPLIRCPTGPCALQPRHQHPPVGFLTEAHRFPQIDSVDAPCRCPSWVRIGSNAIPSHIVYAQILIQ